MAVNVESVIRGRRATFHSMEPRRTRLAVYAVAISGDAILLTRIAPGYPGERRWTLPGGGVEWGEHPEQTLRREVFEETSLEVTSLSFVGIDSRVLRAVDGHSEVHAVRLLYEVPLIGDPVVREVSGSTDAVAWILLTEVSSVDTIDLVAAGLAMVAH